MDKTIIILKNNILIVDYILFLFTNEIKYV